MPFPDSPFDDFFNTRILFQLKDSSECLIDDNAANETLKWLCTSPKLTTFRINTLKTSKDVVQQLIQDQLDKIMGFNIAKAEFSILVDNVIEIKHVPSDLSSSIQESKEIIVDVECAAAVLRGAHIYAPGILGMQSGTQLNDQVKVYADVSGKCKKGWSKLYLNKEKEFIGNGVVQMTRNMLFGENICPNGIAVEMKNVISNCPPMGNEFLPSGYAMLQNLPSIICVESLDPQKGETIVDLCAAPGNKTAHIAALTENNCKLIAFDKTPKKIALLNDTCLKYEIKALVLQQDSTKIIQNLSSFTNILTLGQVDRVLLDAPCSALGKRPQFRNKTTEKVIQSYVPLQRKLFETAVLLLKSEGTLVYSTCTISLAENEGIVAWALRTWDCLELMKPRNSFGGPGWVGTSLSETYRNKVQRFGPKQIVDSAGFFIACFRKK
ncbi:hypothetical protein ABEB36_003881 [Hypothenemus hampei]|uniref:SAM-dependent MTase RsmB/NOP-type domain-containing protein n=1 Tax=Hypothenemus hampei TaxID=57062 RepID=A0ABD1F1F4_HYPHA